MADVVIIGAGPSGLMMAAEALRQGLTCRIIDKSSGPSDQSKALAVQARTLEILDYLSVADACVEQGVKVDRVVPTRHGKPLCTISFKDLDSPFPFVLSLEQSKLERILIHRLEDMGCMVEREVELLDFRQSEEGVEYRLQHHRSGVEEKGKTAWLIGCDGAHSTVRKKLNIEFEGFPFPQLFSLADLEIEWKYPRDCFIGFVETSGILFAIPLKGKNRYRLVFQLDRGVDFLREHQQIHPGEISASLLSPPTLEEVQRLVHKWADADAVLRNPVWMTNFSISSRMVNRYQIGRIFLVGDAAHIHSPIGGQGMNTGLQDAFNLAWKLAYVHKGIAPSALLESYHEERYFVGKRLLKGTEQATEWLLTRSKILFYFRNALLSLFTSLPLIQKKITETISEINICYPCSRWITQTGSHSPLRAGMRAPHLFSLLKDTTTFHLLLVDSKSPSANLDALAKTFATDYLRVHVMQDCQRPFEDRTLYLIRPDGYIGYSGPIQDLTSLKKYLLDFQNNNSRLTNAFG